MSNRTLEGRIALVTGASRGVGKGIALQLGQAGCKVYITGREPSKSYAVTETSLPSLEETARAIRDRGSEAVPVYCDHSKDEDVKKLFEKIEKDNDGVLDILVNNAFSAVKEFREGGGSKFFEMPPSFWDSVNNVGLRNHYNCSVYAARMMVKRRSGLIVNISSAGSLQFIFNVAYGCNNVALDKMAADMAHELREYNVACISLWPGAVRTEMNEIIGKSPEEIEKVLKMDKELIEKQMKGSESPEFVGKAIVAVAADEKKMQKSGKILLTYDVALEYGYKDIDGKLPLDMRQASTVLEFLGWKTLASYIPSFIRVPLFAMHMAGYKFL